MVSTTMELTWLSYLLRDIDITLFEPSRLFCDNISALRKSMNLMFNAQSKHIKLITTLRERK